jgi:hypothetical protein
MKLILKRTDFRDDGIFGTLSIEGAGQIAVTLERSYNKVPKIVAGNYTCKRSMHRLHGMIEDFETFQVMKVPKCTGILFHWGNYNKDSEGCVLLGTAVNKHDAWMITNSRIAFANFMKKVKDLQSFQLEVTNG